VRILTGDVSGRRSALLRMRHMDLLCPTEAEMRDALHDYDASLNAAVWRLMNATDTRHVIVTMGPDGLIGFERVPGAERETGWNTRVRGEHVPALAPFALDPLGCGDALLAAATLTLICGGSISDASFLGAVAAATEAGRLGNQVIHAGDLRRGVRQVEGGRLAVRTGAAPGMRAAAL
jgi:sugar/nucleoside kinase (ribokinase family)